MLHLKLQCLTFPFSSFLKFSGACQSVSVSRHLSIFSLSTVRESTQTHKLNLADCADMCPRRHTYSLWSTVQSDCGPYSHANLHSFIQMSSKEDFLFLEVWNFFLTFSVSGIDWNVFPALDAAPSIYNWSEYVSYSPAGEAWYPH